MILGITGGTGCGKTTLLDTVRSLGGVVLDCDAIYHELLAHDPRLLQAIEAQFPGTVEQGVLLRKKLGALVFADPQALQQLNAITHQAVAQQVKAQLACNPPLAAIDAIGLFESGLDKLCDVTVAVTAPTESRIDRLMHRDGISRHYALARINAQKSNEEFARLCDHTLDNNGTPQEFSVKCLAFFAQLGIINA